MLLGKRTSYLYALRNKVPSCWRGGCILGRTEVPCHASRGRAPNMTHHWTGRTGARASWKEVVLVSMNPARLTIFRERRLGGPDVEGSRLTVLTPPSFPPSDPLSCTAPGSNLLHQPSSAPTTKQDALRARTVSTGEGPCRAVT